MRNDKLIKAREERGWTQEKAAEKIGVSRITYARWEEKGLFRIFRPSAWQVKHST